MGSLKKTADEIEARLKRWSARIDELAAKTDRAGARATTGEQLRAEELRVCRAVLEARLREHHLSGEAQGEHLARGVRQAWSDLAAAMTKMCDR